MLLAFGTPEGTVTVSMGAREQDPNADGWKPGVNFKDIFYN